MIIVPVWLKLLPNGTMSNLLQSICKLLPPTRRQVIIWNDGSLSYWLWLSYCPMSKPLASCVLVHLFIPPPPPPPATKLVCVCGGGGYIGFTLSVCLSVCPSVCPLTFRVRPVASAVQDGFFPYVIHMINSMRGCVLNHSWFVCLTQLKCDFITFNTLYAYVFAYILVFRNMIIPCFRLSCFYVSNIFYFYPVLIYSPSR